MSPTTHALVRETTTGSIELKESGLIYVRMREDSNVGIAEVDEINAAIIELSAGKPCYLVVIPGAGTHADNEARAHAAKFREEKRIVAEAIVVQNLPLRLLANFYIKFNKPQQKVRVFGKEHEALEWLLRVKTENSH